MRIGDKGTAHLVDVDYCLFKVNVGSSLHVEYIVTFIFRLCFSLMYNGPMKGQKVKSFVFCFTWDFFDFNRTLPSLICPVTSKPRKSEVQGHKFKVMLCAFALVGFCS